MLKIWANVETIIGKENTGNENDLLEKLDNLTKQDSFLNEKAIIQQFVSYMKNQKCRRCNKRI